MKPEQRLEYCSHSSDKEMLDNELTVDMNECCFTDTILWMTSVDDEISLLLETVL